MPARAARSALHAAAELLPVSSSGHLRALGGDDDVGAHLVPLLATVVAWRSDVLAVLRRLDRRRIALHLAAGAIPSAAGVLAGDRRDALPLGPGLLAGAALLAGAEAVDGGRSRWDAGLADGLWLGAAQAAALWPGVSRLGTTLVVARLRGFAPEAAPLLAREVGVPVTLGALALGAARGRRRAVRARARPETATGWLRLTGHDAAKLNHPRLRAAAAAVGGAAAAIPLARRVDRGGALWPYAAERALLALVVLRQSRRDARRPSAP